VSEFEEIPLEASGETVELERQIALTAEASAQTGAEIPLVF
jgi:hypothetical protein